MANVPLSAAWIQASSWLSLGDNLFLRSPQPESLPCEQSHQDNADELLDEVHDDRRN